MKLVTLCKALGDESRARIINVLLRYELNVGELVQALGMGQSRVSRHLKILADSGLALLRRDGLCSFYRAVDEGDARRLMDAAAPLMEGRAARKDLEAAQAVVGERARATRRFFDAIAGEWDRLRRDVLGELDLEAAIVARMSAVTVAADLGCGTGGMLARMASKASRVIGVDNSPGMLKEAAQRFQDGDTVSLRIGELAHLPMRDWEVEFAALSMALHHLSDPRPALGEAARVLKFGGRLVVAEFDAHGVEAMRSEYGDHRLGIARSDMLEWLRQARFDASVAAEFPVNKGLVVVLYEAVKK